MTDSPTDPSEPSTIRKLEQRIQDLEDRWEEMEERPIWGLLREVRHTALAAVFFSAVAIAISAYVWGQFFR